MTREEARKIVEEWAGYAWDRAAAKSREREIDEQLAGLLELLAD